MQRPMHPPPLLRWGLAVLSAALCLSATAQPALACSCIQITPVQAIGQTPAIFSGRVVDVQHGQPIRHDNLTATISVTDRWKGEVADRVTVYGSTESSSCGYSHFPVGEVVMLERWTDPAAIEAYTDLATLAPTMEAAQLGLARALRQGRRLSDAKAAAARALALAPSDPEATRLDVQLRF